MTCSFRPTTAAFAGVLGCAASTNPEPDAACHGEKCDAFASFAGVRVESYDYRFDWRSRQASSELTIAVDEPGECLSLAMQTGPASRVMVDGSEPAGVDFAAGKLMVCDVALATPGVVTLAVEGFEVPLGQLRSTQVGLTRVLDLEGAPFDYLQNWVGECARFGPCDPSPAGFADFRFDVAHDDGVTVLCPGTIERAPEHTLCTFEVDGAPTYSSFMIAASPSWSSVDLGVWDGVAVELWDMPGADLAAEIDRERDSGFMAFLQQTFGPYPYGDRMRLFAAPMTWGGYEHPGVIAMNATLTGPAFANTLHHEIAHMWAGDQTTIASIRDFVWKEATAEYLTFVYAEQSGDEQRAREKLQAWHSQALNSTVHAVPGEPLELVDFYGEVYSQGPLVLYRQIEAMFGRDKVITALQSVLGRPRVLSVDELRIALEAATGANLEAYFRRWVNGTGTPARPIFDVSVVNHRHEVTVAVRQPEQPDPFGCAFSVRLQAADGQTFDVRFDLGPSGQLEAVQSVSAGFAVVAAQFDPELECLARASVTIQ